VATASSIFTGLAVQLPNLTAIRNWVKPDPGLVNFIFLFCKC